MPRDADREGVKLFLSGYLSNYLPYLKKTALILIGFFSLENLYHRVKIRNKNFIGPFQELNRKTR